MTEPARLVPAETLALCPRIGLANLTRLAFNGEDLNAVWSELVPKLKADTADVDTAMDLSVIAQLVGQQELGLQLQAEALSVRTLYRSPCGTDAPRLRLLAFAAATDIGGNTPLEFLLEGSDIELYVYYVVPGAEPPEVLPEHDVAFVAVPDSDETRRTLDAIQLLTRDWPRPVLNRPRRITELERDRLHKLLTGAPGIEIPGTARVDRDDLEDVLAGETTLEKLLADNAISAHHPAGRIAGRAGPGADREP